MFIGTLSYYVHWRTIVRPDRGALRASGERMNDHPVAPIASPGEAPGEQNLLLRRLEPPDLELLSRSLQHEPMTFGRLLIEAGEPITRIYFPRTGVASVLRARQEGGVVEAATVGFEGFVGIPVLFGSDTTSSRVVVQVPGEGASVPVEALRELVEQRPAARHLFMRYAHYYTEQLAQSVACNRLHTLEERCAKWLLMSHDRTPGAHFVLTHQYLSQMLGVRRAGVTVAMGVLQQAGLVRYVRGRVTVLDRQRLEEAACDCYAITREELERVMG